MIMKFILRRRCCALNTPYQRVIIFRCEIASLLNVGLRILVSMNSEDNTKLASVNKFRTELFLAAALVDNHFSCLYEE